MTNEIYLIKGEAEELLGLKIEQLGMRILEHFESLEPSTRDRVMKRGNFFNYAPEFFPGSKEEIQKAFAEAWCWLEHELLIAPMLWEDRNIYFITRNRKSQK